MSFISRMIARLLPAATISQRDSQNPPLLLKMPTEILLMLGEYLSPVDWACLAFCSHALLARLGAKSLLLCKDDPKTARNVPDETSTRSAPTLLLLLLLSSSPLGGRLSPGSATPTGENLRVPYSAARTRFGAVCSRPPSHFFVLVYLLSSVPGYAAVLLRSAIRYPARVVVVRGSYVRRRGAHDIIVRRGADLLRTDKPMLADAAIGRIQAHGARYRTLKV